MPDDPNVLLELNGVYRRFLAGDETITVLHNINLRVRAGEMVAIMGASGSGKSTLMNILGCLDRPNRGSYKIKGRETRQMSEDELAQLRRENFGFIFQRYHLLPHLSALHNVEVPAIYAGKGIERRHHRARALLERLGLADRLHHRPHQLSGGQQQRVSIARALMNGGEVILADEPTGALDSKSGEAVMAVLRDLNRRGRTVILVTHDRDVARHAGRIVELRDGYIVSDKTSPTCITQGQHQSRPEQSSLVATLSRFTEAFRMAAIAMMTHRMRTLLTMLGIIIGIMAVVSVVALGQGARERVIADINAMGTNTIHIYPGSGWGDKRVHVSLLPTDLEPLSRLPYLDSLTPEVNGNTTLRHGSQEVQTQVIGVSEQCFRVRGYKITSGRPFSASDVAQYQQAVVIDQNTRKALFSEAVDPVGKIVLAGSVPLKVVAVAEAKGGMMGMEKNLIIWIPYTTAMGKLTGQKTFDSIIVRVKDGVSPALAERNIVALFELRHGGKTIFTNSSDTILQAVSRTTMTMTLLISAIAVISLIVGGIGVMNIMLVSVTERTQEIGIRMAVGARQSDILQQFLIEAVLVCLIGGVIGIIGSYGVAAVFDLVVSEMQMKFSIWSVVAAFATAFLIGLIFGFLPAKNAAKLDPIQALARE